MENTANIETLIQTALDSFGLGFATAKSRAGIVVIRDRKGRVMGNVDATGNITREYDGRKALMGAMVRDRIAAALRTEVL